MLLSLHSVSAAPRQLPQLLLRHLHRTVPRNADGGAIVRRLKQEYADMKKLHLQSAKENGAAILSLSDGPDQLKALKKNYGLRKDDHETGDAIYGFGITSPDQVFINNELSLEQIQVYGFDYDYTLANYTDELPRTVYNILRDILVDMLRYPKAIKDMEFDPSFAIRGLHYDFNKGWLMKIDSFANVQLNTVHVGREPINNVDQVIQHYGGSHISPDYLKHSMLQLNDLFSTPQATLLSDVIHYFKEHDISFHPRYLYDDVNLAASILHRGNGQGGYGIGGRLHMAIMKDIPRYLDKAPNLVSFLENLRRQGKQTFLLTNSSLPFVTRGMEYLTSSPDWRELFDVVTVYARKPDFFRSYRPFRRTREPTWSSVDSFEPGEVYQGGNLRDFSRMTGWSGQKVLYFGDHIFSDLVDPTIQQGWRTGAIIRELKAEIETRNTASYRHTLSWLLHLERMINDAQTLQMETNVDELGALRQQWRVERRQARYALKHVFNQTFGSVFRTYQNPTFFANKIRKFADVYMTNVSNLEQFPLDYVFYPDRTYLPHERLVESLIDTGKIKSLLKH